MPAPELLPVKVLADCARAAIERDGRTVLNYGPVGGYGPLREWVAERHGVEPGRVLVTNGSLRGCPCSATTLLERGSRLLVEGPTYDRALHIAARHEAEPVPVPMDEEGLDPDALELPAAFLYALPTFQNPSGRTLPLDRRQRLVELAREHSLTVLEDDPYGRVRFDGEALPTLFELEGGEGVLYSSSFSKIVAPGLRVGYLVGFRRASRPRSSRWLRTSISRRCSSARRSCTSSSGAAISTRTSRVSGLLKARRDAMLDALDAELPEGARSSRPEGGYFLWLDLPTKSMRPSCSSGPSKPASPSCAAAISTRTAQEEAGVPPGLPSASCRPPRSGTASAFLPSCWCRAVAV